VGIPEVVVEQIGIGMGGHGDRVPRVLVRSDDRDGVVELDPALTGVGLYHAAAIFGHEAFGLIHGFAAVDQPVGAAMLIHAEGPGSARQVGTATGGCRHVTRVRNTISPPGIGW
jgi:hypothetical protein